MTVLALSCGSRVRLGVVGGGEERYVLGGHSAVAAGSRFEADSFAVSQRAQSRALESGDVDKDVGGALVRRNDPVALGRVELLDGSGRHGCGASLDGFGW